MSDNKKILIGLITIIALIILSTLASNNQVDATNNNSTTSTNVNSSTPSCH